MVQGYLLDLQIIKTELVNDTASIELQRELHSSKVHNVIIIMYVNKMKASCLETPSVSLE